MFPLSNCSLLRCRRFGWCRLGRRGTTSPRIPRVPRPTGAACPVPTCLAGSSYEEIAIVKFNLDSPFPETHSEAIWKAYYDERVDHSQLQVEESNPSSPYESEEDPFLKIVRQDPFKDRKSVV